MTIVIIFFEILPFCIRLPATNVRVSDCRTVLSTEAIKIREVHFRTQTERRFARKLNTDSQQPER